MSTPLVHLRDIQKRPVVFTVWEKVRNRDQVHWAMECFAEAVRGLLKLLPLAVVNVGRWESSSTFTSVIQASLAWSPYRTNWLPV